MEYTSTRNSSQRIDAAQAILTGLSPDGGLFVPVSIKPVDIASLQGKSYTDVAFEVLRGFLSGYDNTFLKNALAASYSENFSGKAGHLVRLNDSLFSLELWHGPTAAFKDYALQFMPHLLMEARRMKKQEGRTLILVATSGDTGKAALEGFKNKDGVSIAVFYPNQGTSEIQRLQMVTQDGNNVAVYAINGTFDDAQRGVKAAFTSTSLAKKLAQKGDRLSSANSINWGRLVPQIVYYVTSYLQVCAQGAARLGDEVDFCVPTGNFGDIMAGYYAKAMGLPIGKLICASNRNNVLADFFATGHYNAKREFYKTSSPSMDILVSSNLERLLYHASGSDTQVKEWMKQLAEQGEYRIDEATLAEIRRTFVASWADENAVSEEIANTYHNYQYLCDPHTAVAFQVQKMLSRPGSNRPTVVLSTASPFKFSEKVLSALGQSVPENEFEALQKLEQITGQKAPVSLSSLRDKPIRFTDVIDDKSIADIPLHL